MKRMTKKGGNIMINFLKKYSNIFALAVMVLCLVLVLCPIQAQAADLDVAVYSPTNPDHIFTGDEAYDITLFLQGNAGETYLVNYEVTDSRKMPMAKSWEPIPVTLSGDGQGELVLDLSALKFSRDTFQVKVTVTTDIGAEVGSASCSFSRVAKDSVFSQIANVQNGIQFSIDNGSPNLYLYLKKTDRFTETVTVTYWITDVEGNMLRQAKGQVSVPTKEYLPLPLNFYGLEASGMCRISYVVYDDTNNLRASGNTYFMHYGTEYIYSDLRSLQNKVGLIFTNNEPYDLVLDLKKTDHFDEVFDFRYTITNNSGEVVKEFSDKLNIPEAEVLSLTLDLSDITEYGIYDLTFTATDRFGNEKTRTFSFSRALATANPGDIPLVNINDHFTTNKGEPVPKLQLSAQAGFGMWRCAIPWVSVEKGRGNFSMPASVEQVMKTSESLGMEPLIILAYGNDTLYGQPDPLKEGWLEAYVNYCKYIASYFGDRVTYYEIWNEWNHSSMGKTDPNCRDGRYYAMALVAASKAIKSVNPDAVIIGGAMAGHGEDWMVDMLNYDSNGDGKSDAMEAMDGFSFHTYATDWRTCFFSFTEHPYAQDFQEVIEVLNRYGDASTKEIWLTETGWSTCLELGVTEEEQAAYLVQTYTWSMANSDVVDRVFWYDFMNGRDAQTLIWDPYHGEQNCGLIHSWTNTGDEPLAYSAKKSYVAACAMNSLLAGATDGSAYDLGEGIYAYRFQKDGQDLLVAWMHKESKTLNTSFEGSLVVYDMYGNATTYTGTAQLNLSDCPIYIQGDISGLTTQ